MELFCEKYREKVSADKAFCAHPTEYCKFRNACLLHFMGKEKARPASADKQPAAEGLPGDNPKPA